MSLRLEQVPFAHPAKSERGGTMGPAGSSGENRDHFGPASRSGVLGSGGLAPPLFFPMVWEEQDSMPAPVKLDDDARSFEWPPLGQWSCPGLPPEEPNLVPRALRTPGAACHPRLPALSA